MNPAVVSHNGKVTVPKEIRRLLNIKSGDKIFFNRTPGGDVVISKASVQAIYKAQRAFEGVAERLDVQNEDDVQNLVNEVRYGDRR